jgi:hypothetical protein
MEWQRQQPRVFFGESLGHGPCAIVRPATLMRYFIAPHQRLAIALRQSSEDASGPERIPYILALLSASRIALPPRSISPCRFLY